MIPMPGTITANRDGQVSVRLRNGGILTGTFSCELTIGVRVYAFINYDTMRLVGVHPKDVGEVEEVPDLEPQDREEVFDDEEKDVISPFPSVA